MLVLGLNGLFTTMADDILPVLLSRAFFHDATACLVDDTGLVAALEEERLDRSKHTNRFPVQAAAACLELAGATLRDVDRVAYFFREDYADEELGLEYLKFAQVPLRSARDLIVARLAEALGHRIPADRVRFHDHHRAHAAGTFFQSGLDAALVCVVDGNGEEDSLSIYRGQRGRIERLARVSRDRSLGHFYRHLTQFLGYDLFDEYKVMGLAPYGDPGRYERDLAGLYRLLPDGAYELDAPGTQRRLLSRGLRPRRAGEEFSAEHRDLAAALQRTVETILLHVLAYWRRTTGLPALCLAGGVAQNSSLNGRILTSGLFDHVFVHPASHDASATVGAALLEHVDGTGGAYRSCLHIRDAYLGPRLEAGEELVAELERWSDLVAWKKVDDPAAVAAELLASGKVIGWAQGRSELGPRALGNRSILADPRPVANRDRVNDLVKKREGFRPFAPAVQEEAVARFFEVPSATGRLDFMGFVVEVRPEARPLLGAVTHVDGSARVQTVSRRDNPRFWTLIQRFGERTGTPVVLNTSFNNYAEPIVQSARDAIVCFLTTGLDELVMDDMVVSRRPADIDAYSALRPRLAPVAAIEESIRDEASACGPQRVVRHLVERVDRGRRIALSEELYRILARADGRSSVGLLTSGSADPPTLAAELLRLWEARLVVMTPPDHA